MVTSIEVVDLEAASGDTDKSSGVNKNKNQGDNAEYNFMPTTYKDSKDRFGLTFINNMHVRIVQTCMPRRPNERMLFFFNVPCCFAVSA